MQIAQGRVLADWSAESRAQPRRHRAAVPHVVLWRWSPQRLAQLLQLLGRGQERVRMGTPCPPMRGLAVIDEGRCSLLVVAACHSADPIGRIPGHLGHLIRRMPLREQPEEVPVAALGALPGPAVAAFQLVYIQVRRQFDSSWHAPILQYRRPVWYKEMGERTADSPPGLLSHGVSD